MKRCLLVLAVLACCCAAQDTPWSTIEETNHGPAFRSELYSVSKIDLWVKCNLPSECLAAKPVDQNLRFFEQVGQPSFYEGWQTVHYQIVFPERQGNEVIMATVEHWGRAFTYKYKVESWY